MENASKALIMAGSVLLSVMVIGLLVFGYTQISNLEQTRSDTEANSKIDAYMQQIENFNRGRNNPFLRKWVILFSKPYGRLQ